MNLALSALLIILLLLPGLNPGGTMAVSGNNFTIPGKEILSVGITYMKYYNDENTGERIIVPI